MMFQLDNLQHDDARCVRLSVGPVEDGSDDIGLLVQAGLTGDDAPTYAHLTGTEARELARALQMLGDRVDAASTA